MQKRNKTGKHVWWAIAVSIASLAAMGSGCSTRGRSSEQTLSPVAHQSPAASTEPASNPVTKEDALEFVRQQPKVVQYQEALKAKGYNLFLGPQETPSRFIVRVGEVRPEKVTVVQWYLVDKKDGKVTEWKISDGAPPED